MFPLILLASQLDLLIAPEIANDDFYAAIYRLAQTESVATILEIGSSSGEGSTDAFVKGIAQNPSHPTLFCMELSKPRFQALQERYADNPSVICYNVSSVPLESFPTEKEVLRFMGTTETSLRAFGSGEVLRWLRQDIDYLKHADVPQHGIELIRSDRAIESFDMVLIDGSEFTGQAEFALIYGARFILLDDIRAFKNYNNYNTLLEDPNYQLIEEQPLLRSGYAIFRKVQ